MAGFSWISGTLALLLIAGNCVAAVDQNQLAQLVNEIWGKYKINRMFSLAASIPEKKNMNQQYDAKQVFSNENGEEVKMEIKKGNVFNKGRIVAATPLKKKDKTGKDTHAEYRVLQNFDTFINNNDDKAHDLLLFYVLGSPCYDQCTNEGDELNILRFLDQIKKWKHYAFVFTKIYERGNVPNDEKKLRESLKKIGNRIGLQNIFRCTKSDDHMECRSCSAGNQVAKNCVSDDNANKAPGVNNNANKATRVNDNANKAPGVNNNANKAPGVNNNANKATRVNNNANKAPRVNDNAIEATGVISNVLRICAGVRDRLRSCWDSCVQCIPRGWRLGNNVNEDATASSSHRGLDNRSGNDVRTGQRDNERGICARVKDALRNCVGSCVRCIPQGWRLGNNVNEDATASSSRRGLDNRNGNNVRAGQRDNGGGNGLSRGDRNKQGKSKGGSKRCKKRCFFS